MVFELQAIEYPHNGVWAIYSVTYTSSHLNSLSIYDPQVIVIAIEECVIVQLSTFLSNKLYSLP